MTPQQTNPWLAVHPLGDRLAHARALRRVHDLFHAGHDVGGQVRAVVAQSWARAGDAGLDPERDRAPIVMDDRELGERWSQHPLFPVLPVLRDLLTGATSESAHMLVISDAAGVLMWMEGHHRVIEATSEMHFVCGADWSETAAGTNALGTAIAVDHPVQIFSAEHFNRMVHPWQCSGAPIHDPATGRIIGVVDLTGHLRTAHPHTLALVTAAAGMAEAYLRQDLLRKDERLREAYHERVSGSAQPSALVRSTGEVLVASPSRWVVGTVPAPVIQGELLLPGGVVADVDPIPGHDGLVLWQRQRRAPTDRAPTPLRLDLLGRRPRLRRSDGIVELSGRHAEILGTLLLLGRGVTVEELTLEVYGETGRPGTLRSEISRLRRVTGDQLLARPYAFSGVVVSDLLEVEALLADGRVADALRLGSERLLPDSVAPRIVEARDRLEHGLRQAVLRSLDPELLVLWCASVAGQDDEVTARALVTSLDEHDSRRPAAEARVARLARIFGG